MAINPSDFTVTNLPRGLRSGQAAKIQSNVVRVPITGTPTTAVAPVGEAVQPTVPYIIPKENLLNSTEDAVVTNNIGRLSVSKGDGAACVIHSVKPSFRNDFLVVDAEVSTNPVNTGQIVEYCLYQELSGIYVQTRDWQDEAYFGGLIQDYTYRVGARSKENQNYNAGSVVTSDITMSPLLLWHAIFNIDGTVSVKETVNDVTPTLKPGSGTIHSDGIHLYNSTVYDAAAKYDMRGTTYQSNLQSDWDMLVVEIDQKVLTYDVASGTNRYDNHALGTVVSSRNRDIQMSYAGDPSLHVNNPNYAPVNTEVTLYYQIFKKEGLLCRYGSMNPYFSVSNYQNRNWNYISEAVWFITSYWHAPGSSIRLKGCRIYIIQ